MIYLLRLGDRPEVKIGFTTNLPGRARYYETHFPGTVVVIQQLEGTKADEKALHQRFAHLRVKEHRGTEWFHFHPDMMGDLGLPDAVAPTEETKPYVYTYRPWTPEQRLAQSERKLRFHADPEKHALYVAAVRRKSRERMTFPRIRDVFRRLSARQIAEALSLPLAEVYGWESIPLVHAGAIADLLEVPMGKLTHLVTGADAA